MNTIPHCPDCEKQMVKGFIPDTTLLGALQATWHPDDPESAGGTFFGFKTKNRTKTVRIEESRTKKIISYRCPECGLLRSFAE
ncbi:PF20097 family protein [Gimesia maris]|uniref:PF20097 family protein n=1 Tax=Gimesia maris TaxID=122 RepID=UPI0039C8AEA9|tara:strand:+ start:1048 stop:1296 length:249 start_codon:yes stop_codon:yes gene_type:complete